MADLREIAVGDRVRANLPRRDRGSVAARQEKHQGLVTEVGEDGSWYEIEQADGGHFRVRARDVVWESTPDHVTQRLSL
jgi:hypothetical protein